MEGAESSRERAAGRVLEGKGESLGLGGVKLRSRFGSRKPRNAYPRMTAQPQNRSSTRAFPTSYYDKDGIYAVCRSDYGDFSL